MGEREIAARIDAFWAARMAPDKDALVAMLAPGCRYEMIGGLGFAPQAAVGPVDATSAAEHLMRDFAFHEREQLALIVAGQSAASVNRLQLSFRGGDKVWTEACDVWEFDAAAQVTSLKQFVDTAFVRSVMGL